MILPVTSAPDLFPLTSRRVFRSFPDPLHCAADRCEDSRFQGPLNTRLALLSYRREACSRIRACQATSLLDRNQKEHARVFVLADILPAPSSRTLVSVLSPTTTPCGKPALHSSGPDLSRSPGEEP